MKPSLFIGSSSESLDVAYAVQSNLEQDAEVTVWSQGIFELSKFSLESLDDTLDKTDFGAFIFTPNDIIRIRDVEFQTVRDNVIFELGLFIGRLGRHRSYLIMPRGISDFHLPSDLLGISSATYDPHRQDQNLEAALGPACHSIRKAIQKMSGSLRKDETYTKPPSSVSTSTSPSKTASGLSEPAGTAKLISTTQLAKQANIAPKEMFAKLLERGWIVRDGEKWQLTEAGQAQGGVTKHSRRFGEYVAWPADLAV